MMAKLVITIDLDKKSRPSADEIADLRMNDELEYWIDMVYTDPPEMFNGATWEIVEEGA